MTRPVSRTCSNVRRVVRVLFLCDDMCPAARFATSLDCFPVSPREPS